MKRRKKQPSLLKIRAWDNDHGVYMSIGSNYTQCELNKDGTFRIFDSRGVNDCTIEFCTGAMDKDGNDIYQGDIVRTKDMNRHSDWEVMWEKTRFMLVSASRDGDEFGTYRQFLTVAKRMEVIGNIHENKLVASKEQ